MSLAKFTKFIPFKKLEEGKEGQPHMVWGVATSEAVDADGEICDYEAAKTEFQRWSKDFMARTSGAGQEPSLGNMRVMHSLTVGGKAVKIEYNDETKQIWLGAEPKAEVWSDIKKGYLTGYSIGGGYAWTREEGPNTRYAPRLAEVSFVDNPCNPDAVYNYVKADGTSELRKFKSVTKAKPLTSVAKATATKRVSGEDLSASDFIIVGDREDTSTWKLPYNFSTENKTKAHLRNALVRFSSLQDVDEAAKRKAWRKLVSLCEDHGIDVSDSKMPKADEGDLRKSLGSISCLARLLDDVRYLRLMSINEAEWEDDEEDLVIAEKFRVWLEDGFEILTHLVQHESRETTAEAV